MAVEYILTFLKTRQGLLDVKELYVLANLFLLSKNYRLWVYFWPISENIFLGFGYLAASDFLSYRLFLFPGVYISQESIKVAVWLLRRVRNNFRRKRREIVLKILLYSLLLHLFFQSLNMLLSLLKYLSVSFVNRNNFARWLIYYW
jgi:hypothetical protein